MWPWPIGRLRRTLLPSRWRRTTTKKQTSYYEQTPKSKATGNITKGKLKQKWAKLTDDDLQFVEGKHDEVLGRIQKRTGETREAVEKGRQGSLVLLQLGCQPRGRIGGK